MTPLFDDFYMPQHAEIIELLSKANHLALLDPVLSLQYIDRAYSILLSCKLIDVELLAKVTLPYSRLLYAFGRIDESLIVLFRALTQAELASQKLAQEELLQDIASTYYALGDYQEAGEYWADCFLCDGFSAVARLNAHIGMGMIQFAHGQIEQALVQHQYAITLLNKQMPPLLHARAWINVASDFFKLNQWHESQHALVVAYPFAKQAQHHEFIGEIYIYMAKIALETNNLDSARQRLAQAKDSCKEWRWGDIMQQLLQGRIFVACAQMDEAIACFKNALAKAQEMGSAQQIMDAHHLLSMAYQRTGNTELAEYEYGCYQAACIRMKLAAEGASEHAIRRLIHPAEDGLGMLHCA